MKWLGGTTNKSSLPSLDNDGRSSKSSDWSDDGGTRRPTSSHSDTAPSQSSTSALSTGIVVTISDGAAITAWPCVDTADKQLGLHDWHRVYSMEETNLSLMQIPASVACAV